MNSKFIKLTTRSGRNLFLNPSLIASIEHYFYSEASQGAIVITICGIKDHYVQETPEEIMKLIKDSEKYVTFKQDENHRIVNFNL